MVYHRFCMQLYYGLAKDTNYSHKYLTCHDLYRGFLHGIFHPGFYLYPSHLAARGVADSEVYLRCQLSRLRLRLFED